MVAFTPTTTSESDLFTPITFPNGSEQYVAVTYNNSSLAGNLYHNGAFRWHEAFTQFHLLLPALMEAQAARPKIGWERRHLGDPQFQGTIYELRIWNGVVSQRQIAASAHARSSVLVTNLTPTSASVTAGPSWNVTGTEQATVTVTLPQTGASQLLATGDATNWTSSNPSVLTVNSSGLITGVGAGTATVSATVGGVTGTSGTITVTPHSALLHRYSFVSDASDSVGGSPGMGRWCAPSDVTEPMPP